MTASLQLITRRVSIVIVEFHFAKMTGGRRLANERRYTAYKCCLSIFTNVKVPIINRDSSSGVFCCCLTFNVEYLPS